MLARISTSQRQQDRKILMKSIRENLPFVAHVERRHLEIYDSSERSKLLKSSSSSIYSRFLTKLTALLCSIFETFFITLIIIVFWGGDGKVFHFLSMFLMKFEIESWFLKRKTDPENFNKQRSNSVRPSMPFFASRKKKKFQSEASACLKFKVKSAHNKKENFRLVFHMIPLGLRASKHLILIKQPSVLIYPTETKVPLCWC